MICLFMFSCISVYIIILLLYKNILYYLVYKKNWIFGWGHVNGGSTQDEELKSSLTETGGVGVVCSWMVEFFCFDVCLFSGTLDGRSIELTLLFWAVKAAGCIARALGDNGIWILSGFLPWHNISSEPKKNQYEY